MVKSKLNSKIVYNEKKEIEEVDKNYNAPLYEIELLNSKILIAIGKVNNSLKKYSILYYPIYIIHDNKVVNQIGVYEVTLNKALALVDEDNDIDIGLLDKPLLYEYVNKYFIEEYRIINVNGKSDNLKTNNLKTNNREKETNLVKQTKEEAELDRKTYKKVDNKQWIQNYMRDNNYKMINISITDSIFNAISMGLNNNYQEQDVINLRKILFNNVKQNTYNTLYNSYQDYVKRKKQLQIQKKDLKKKWKILKNNIQKK